MTAEDTPVALAVTWLDAKTGAADASKASLRIYLPDDCPWRWAQVFAAALGRDAGPAVQLNWQYRIVAPSGASGPLTSRRDKLQVVVDFIGALHGTAGSVAVEHAMTKDTLADGTSMSSPLRELAGRSLLEHVAQYAMSIYAASLYRALPAAEQAALPADMKATLRRLVVNLERQEVVAKT